MRGNVSGVHISSEKRFLKTPGYMDREEAKVFFKRAERRHNKASLRKFLK